MPTHRRPNIAGVVVEPERRHFLKRLVAFLAGGALFAGAKQAFAETQVPTGATPYLGEIMMTAWASSSSQSGWLECDGQLLAISQNQALFSLLGTTYGGDGRTTFAIPDLRGRFPMHEGSGPGLTQRNMGQGSGQEAVFLTQGEMPSHTHSAAASSNVGTQATPVGNAPAVHPAGTPIYGTSNANTAPGGYAGSSQSHNNMPPYGVVKFFIAVTGQFPPFEPNE